MAAYYCICSPTLLFTGHTTGKEYAELEWPIDIAITLIWVVFGINMFGNDYQKKGTPSLCGHLVLYRYMDNCCHVAHC